MHSYFEAVKMPVSEELVSKVAEDVGKLLKELSDSAGPSGMEEEVRDVIAKEVKDYVDRLEIDALGNLIGIKKGTEGGPKIMIAAHMDEVGLIITYIGKDGFLRFTKVGGVSERYLNAQRVVIKTRKGRVLGVVGSKPVHLLKPEEAQKVPPLEELFIDVGASSEDEVKKMGIRVGDRAVLDRGFKRMNGYVVTGKALDDRVGCAVLIETLKLLSEKEHDATVYAVATSQEEVGLRGARVAAFKIKPDLGIAVDVTIANDVAGVSESDRVTRLGKGPAIKVMDSGLLVSPKVQEYIIKVAEREGIPYQLEVISKGSTDAAAIQLTREGVVTGAVSIPTRYLHSPVETLNLKDAAYASILLSKLVEGANKEDLEKLKGDVLKG